MTGSSLHNFHRRPSKAYGNISRIESGRHETAVYFHMRRLAFEYDRATR